MSKILSASLLFLGLNISVTVLAAETASDNKGHAEAPHWEYTGDAGPEHWGELGSDFAMCTVGKNQSPVDIDSTQVQDTELEPIKFNYGMLIPDEIKNNGHSIQVDMSMGSSIDLDGEEFELKQFHFHSPSEHTVNGKHFPLEAHFVHANKDGEIAVVAMMFVPGLPDRTIANLWEQMPQKPGDAHRLSSKALKTIEMRRKMDVYYRYNGSLTTPPCSEAVRWIVMKSPMTISKEQLDQFQAVMKGNNRPVQDLNARKVMD